MSGRARLVSLASSWPETGQSCAAENGFVAALAGGRLGLHCDDAEILGFIRRRFARFVVSGAASWTLDMHCDGEPPAVLASPSEVYPEPLELTATCSGVSITAASYRAEVDLEAQRVRIEGPRATFPLDGTLRVLLPLMVKDGLLVHGGMLEEAGRAWVCSGPSGSGKSTLCELLPGQARCDEMVALRRIAGQWVAQSMPFWRARPAQAPVEGLLLLAHGARDRKHALGPAELGHLLSREVLWPVGHQEALAARFELFGALLSEVPAWRLEFRPTPAVWSVIAGSAA